MTFAGSFMKSARLKICVVALDGKVMMSELKVAVFIVENDFEGVMSCYFQQI